MKKGGLTITHKDTEKYLNQMDKGEIALAKILKFHQQESDSQTVQWNKWKPFEIKPLNLPEMGVNKIIQLSQKQHRIHFILYNRSLYILNAFKKQSMKTPLHILNTSKKRANDLIKPSF